MMAYPTLKLFIISSTYDVCKAYLALFIRLRDFLGIPIAPDKTFGPSTVLMFAGIELDPLIWKARLPQEKIDKCVQSIAGVAMSVLLRSQHSSNTMRMGRAAVLHNKTSSWSEISPLLCCSSARQLR